MIQELRYALRGWMRRPGLTAVAVLTLALGIGATSAIYSIVQGVLLSPFPWGEPEELIRVRHHPLQLPETTIEISYTDWQEYRQHLELLDDVAAVASTSGGLVIERDGIAESVGGHIVTSNFFELLGVAPKIGRVFSDADAGPGQAPSVVLSETLWQRRFGADRARHRAPARIRPTRRPRRFRTAVAPSIAGREHAGRLPRRWARARVRGLGRGAIGGDESRRALFAAT